METNDNIEQLEDELLRLGKLFLDGEIQDCRNGLQSLLQQEPGFGQAHHLLGRLYLEELTDKDKALMHFSLAVKFAPRFAPAHYSYLQLLVSMGRHDELICQARESLKQDTVNRTAIYCWVSESYEQQGFNRQALHACEQAILSAASHEQMEYLVQSRKRLKNKRGLQLAKLLKARVNVL